MNRYIATGACALSLGACAYQPTPLPDVAPQQAALDTSVGSSPVYTDPLSGYTYRGPTGPRDWRAVNQEQSEGN